MNDFIDRFYTKNSTAFFCFLAFACACGAAFRFEQWFDFVNYHYYNVWAYYNGRADVDVLPAFVNTFFSPFADIPAYHLVNALNRHPVLFSAVMAVPYALLLFAVYKTASLFFSPDTRSGRIRIGLTLLLCVFSANIFSQICTTTNDVPLSAGVVAALYLTLHAVFFDRRSCMAKLTAAGFLLGAATGLKLTFTPYAVATGLTLILFYRRIDRPVSTIALFAVSGAAGFATAYGYWGWTLWQRYGNPFFPFFNSVFPSPYWDGGDYTDSRYFDKPLIDLILWPFLMFFDPTGEVPLQRVFVPSNLRYAVLYVLLIGSASNMKKEQRKPSPELMFSIVWLAVAWAVWLAFFRVQRYLIAFEAVSGIVLVHALFKRARVCLKNKRFRLFLAFLAATAVCMPFVNYSRPIGENLLPDDAFKLPSGSLLVLTDYPTALFVPFLAPDNATPAITHPMFAGEVNGSDFHARGPFARKRNRLFSRHLKSGTVYWLTVQNTDASCRRLFTLDKLPLYLCGWTNRDF